MMRHRYLKPWTAIATALTLIVAPMAPPVASAATLDEVFRVAQQINSEARRSQARIDNLTDETRDLLNEYKTVLKQIEGLRVYNTQLERQIDNQEKELAQLAESIDQVTVIERQIMPLMLRMIDGLEQFVSLDLPFLIDERSNRIAELRAIMDRADVAVSEKFSRVLRAYQIENEYGRTMEAYSGTITIAGTERKVDILKLGRIALVYQSPDAAETGMYNAATGSWEQLDDTYRNPVRNGIRMARKQLSQDMLVMPVRGPETAQ